MQLIHAIISEWDPVSFNASLWRAALKIIWWFFACAFVSYPGVCAASCLRECGFCLHGWAQILREVLRVSRSLQRRLEMPSRVQRTHSLLSNSFISWQLVYIMTAVEFATGKISLFRQPGDRDYIQIGWQTRLAPWYLSSSYYQHRYNNHILRDCLFVYFSIAMPRWFLHSMSLLHWVTL